MVPLLYEARTIVHSIFLSIGGIYLLSAILLLSPVSAGVRNLLSYVHVFAFFPTLLFLALNVTLLFLTMKDIKTGPETPGLPQKNIIAGSIAGLLSVGLIIWLLLL